MELLNQLPLPAIFVVCCAALFLVFAYAGVCAAINNHRKAFGKRPSATDEIAALRAEMITVAAAHEAEDAREVAQLRQEILKVDNDVRSLRQSISDNGERRKTEMLAVIENKHELAQDQFNRINEAIGDLSGQLKALLLLRK